MPIHDWKRVKAGIFHDFHIGWCWTLRSTLNRGRLPKGFMALVEQRLSGPEPEVIAVETAGGTSDLSSAVLTQPKTKFAMPLHSEERAYARKANRVVVRHWEGEVVAVIEIVSPGNKSTKKALETFVEKSTAFLEAGVHLMVLDVFPPGRHDPAGVHRAIADEYGVDAYEIQSNKPLTFVSYKASTNPVAYLEPLAVGDELPDMPLFLTDDAHIVAPLAESYAAALQDCPPEILEKLGAKS